MQKRLNLFFRLFIIGALLYSCTKDNSNFSNSNLSAKMVDNLQGDTSGNPTIINWTDSVWGSWYNPLLHPYSYNLPIKFGPPPCSNCVDSSVYTPNAHVVWTVALPPYGIILNATTSATISDGMQINFNSNEKNPLQINSFSIKSTHSTWSNLSVRSYTVNNNYPVNNVYYPYAFTYTLNAEQYFNRFGSTRWWPVLIIINFGYPGSFPLGVYTQTANCQIRIIYPWVSQ